MRMHIMGEFFAKMQLITSEVPGHHRGESITQGPILRLCTKNRTDRTQMKANFTFQQPPGGQGKIQNSAAPEDLFNAGKCQNIHSNKHNLVLEAGCWACCLVLWFIGCYAFCLQKKLLHLLFTQRAGVGNLVLATATFSVLTTQGHFTPGKCRGLHRGGGGAEKWLSW